MVSMYKCKCCDKTDSTVIEKGLQKGLYCNHTGKWIKWLNKDEYNRYLIQNANTDHVDTDTLLGDGHKQITDYLNITYGKGDPYKPGIKKYQVMNAITWREEYYGYDAHEALMSMTTCQECRLIVYQDGEQTHGITFKQYG